eukprot:5499268-Prymnesium_polylepis.1
MYHAHVELGVPTKYHFEIFTHYMEFVHPHFEPSLQLGGQTHGGAWLLFMYWTRQGLTPQETWERLCNMAGRNFCTHNETASGLWWMDLFHGIGHGLNIMQTQRDRGKEPPDNINDYLGILEMHAFEFEDAHYQDAL